MKHGITKKIAGIAVAAGIMSGAGLAFAAPAQAATYHVGLSTWQAYNYPDSAGKIRHFNSTTSGVKYAAWAAKGGTSKQNVCWAGMTGYGFQI
ncbi:hypothetical protein [Leifsonia sp. NCR5]|uniref:hypothetical protein n=1 Tax=Leifsonia sp. NCR5 TaxID=1978342 RepID=UPI000A18C1A3|nr:hypothetical protein [Leifsonia sp. NCR5]